MTSDRTLVIGTRGSALALAQTGIVCDALRRLAPGLEIRVERIVTRGDANPKQSLATLGRGVFVAEIEHALREHRIDVAVHSAKDLPSTLATDVAIAAYLPRADARDVLVSRAGPLRLLPPGARIGTSSPRRMCQVRALRPDLDVREVRGNVDTRLRKLERGEFDALVLAAAGLMRLGRTEVVTEWLDLETIIPCVGQGALAVEIRADDTRSAQLVRQLDDPATRAAVSAERAFLAELGAGCLAPVAAHASAPDAHSLRLQALIGACDGHQLAMTREGPSSDPEFLGVELARAMLRGGGARFLARAESPLTGLRVGVTRAAEQSAELIALLEARGATAIAFPAIEVLPAESAELDAAVAALTPGDWIAFTSANAVRSLTSRLRHLGRALPEGTRVAVVGGATAQAARASLREPAFVSPSGGAERLAYGMPDVAGRRVVFPCGDLSPDSLERALRSRGADVHRVVAYHTVPGAGIAALSGALTAGSLDALAFASPSAVRFAGEALGRMVATGAAKPMIVCIGVTTAAALRDMGLTPTGVAETQSTGGIVEALERAATMGAPTAVTANE